MRALRPWAPALIKRNEPLYIQHCYRLAEVKLHELENVLRDATDFAHHVELHELS
jgi:hypothetical protein